MREYFASKKTNIGEVVEPTIKFLESLLALDPTKRIKHVFLFVSLFCFVCFVVGVFLIVFVSSLLFSNLFVVL
jgi:hypothetical protein